MPVMTKTCSICGDRYGLWRDNCQTCSSENLDKAATMASNLEQAQAELISKKKRRLRWLRELAKDLQWGLQDTEVALIKQRLRVDIASYDIPEENLNKLKPARAALGRAHHEMRRLGSKSDLAKMIEQRARTSSLFDSLQQELRVLEREVGPLLRRADLREYKEIVEPSLGAPLGETLWEPDRRLRTPEGRLVAANTGQYLDDLTK